MSAGRAGRIAGFAALAWLALIQPPPCAAEPARLALIIDDMGNARQAGERAAHLPGMLTCSILPHTAHASRLAAECRKAGKDVFVHLPMQPEAATEDPGPGALLLGQSRDELRRRVRAGLDSVGGAAGVNNHMGSLLTRHIGYMAWLMAELSERGGLVFLDSATTTHSVALRVARAYGVPAVRRDVFLDDDPSPEAVHSRWEALIDIAERRGAAVGIGHPQGSTMALLESEMSRLETRGIILVSVAALVRDPETTEVAAWPSSSSPWLTASKR